MTKSLTAAVLQNRGFKLQAEWTQLHAKRPRILYHYTDAQGLLGMLKTHRLWATNRRFLNDPTETEYAASLIRSLVNGPHTEKHFASSIANKKLRQIVFEKVRQGAEQILSWYVDYDEHYLACFCENGDLLSQWRGYGSVGGGYAAGFVAQDLGLIQYQNEQRPEPVLRKVLYDPRQQENLIWKWVKFISDWETFCCETPESQKAPIDHMGFGWTGFNWFLSQSLRSFKHPAYEEEQEWRVIQVGTAPNGTRAVEPNFRAGRRGVVEYVELDLPASKERLPLEVICYGPMLDPKVTDHSLSLLCRSKGYDKVAIKKSIIPFAG